MLLLQMQILYYYYHNANLMQHVKYIYTCILYISAYGRYDYPLLQIHNKNTIKSIPVKTQIIIKFMVICSDVVILMHDIPLNSN